MNNCVPEKKQSVPRMYGECIVVRGTGGARGRWSLWAVWGWGKTLKQLKSYFNSLFPRAGLSSLGLCFRFQWRIYIYIYMVEPTLFPKSSSWWPVAKLRYRNFWRNEICWNLRSKGDPDDPICEIRHRACARQAQLGWVATPRSACLQWFKTN